MSANAEKLPWALPLHHHVNGSPFQPGDRVRVIALADKTSPAEFLGRVGLVVHLEYSCGCGQTYPGDPMIGVQFFPNQVEKFWREELSLLPKRTTP